MDVDVNVVFIVFPREKGTKVLEELATLTLASRQKRDTTMLEHNVVLYPNIEELELNEPTINLQADNKESQTKPNDILAKQAKSSKHVELEPLVMEVAHFEQDVEP